MNQVIASTRVRFIGALSLACSALLAPAAQAGLFDDSEARQAILDIRQRIDQSNEQSKARDAELSAQLAEQVKLLRRSLLDLNSQIAVLRSEFARLHGQDEQLARDIAEVQRRQKDVQQSVSKLEPQTVTVDGQEFTAEPQEKGLYEEAVGKLRKGDFTAAANLLTEFQSRYPSSGYKELALFWLGNAQYGNRQYRGAISSFRTLVRMAPAHPRAPEALLSIANCQIELKDNRSAQRTLEELEKAYPKSEAAQAGRQRIATLR